MKVYKGRDRGTEILEIPPKYAAEAAVRPVQIMDAAAESAGNMETPDAIGTVLCYKVAR